jgi:putative colanic acid biosynthesis UDP-glucose lipid carrier transferase
MASKSGRFSGYIRPITYALDLVSINILAYFFLSNYLFGKFFVAFISISWIIIAINVSFYEVFRFTKVVSILNKTVKQFILFALVCFAFSQFYVKDADSQLLLKYILSSFASVLFCKLFIFFALKKYRSIFGGNQRKVLIIGNGKNAYKLKDLFDENPDYGCNFEPKTNKKQQFDEIFSFSTENQIDVIFCSLENTSEKEIEELIDFSENELISVKFLPENQDLVSENNKVEYYSYIPVLTLQDTYLDDPITKTAKRIFDVVFSILVIVFVFSWLFPIIAIIIKLDSKGPVFFKQGRPGLFEKEFVCFKFRSMTANVQQSDQTSKGDMRITKVGKFIRKTSIDELPQFFNVLLGDMSVVGPRPNFWTHYKQYTNKIQKYNFRHYVKPGITGLAQVSGFRGEKDEDMENRVNFDVYYIKNWSLFLDLKIIFLTVYNIFKGEEKAY